MNDDSGWAEAAMVFVFFAMLACGGIAFIIAGPMNSPPTKSNEELCQDRGGVWVQPYRSGGKCFSKEAFK